MTEAFDDQSFVLGSRPGSGAMDGLLIMPNKGETAVPCFHDF